MKLINMLKILKSDEVVVVTNDNEMILMDGHAVELWVKYDMLHKDDKTIKLYKSKIVKVEPFSDWNVLGIKIIIDYTGGESK